MRLILAFALLTCLPLGAGAVVAKPEGFAGVPWLSTPEQASLILGVRFTDNCAGKEGYSLVINRHIGCLRYRGTEAGMPANVIMRFDDTRRLVGVSVNADPVKPRQFRTREQSLQDCKILLNYFVLEYGLGETHRSSGLNFEYANAATVVQWQTSVTQRQVSCVVSLRTDSGEWTSVHHYRPTNP